jgi:large subunit ribosomal protein L32
MPVPKQRHTKSRRDRRRSQIKLKSRAITLCPKCKKPVLPHRVCENCGYYKGRQVIDVLAKLEKKERKKKEKELKAAEKETPQKPLSMKELSKK